MVACSGKIGAAMESVTMLLLLLLPLGSAAPPATSHTITRSWCKTPDIDYRVLDSGYDNDADTLFLANCHISTLPLNAFNATVLPRLNRVDITSNDIESIDAALFISVPNLIFLHLGNNKLQQVPIFGAHSLFPRLKVIDLHGNLITGITDDRTFSACAVLEELHASYNQIEHLHPEAFKGTNLKLINLSNNKIKFISEGLFQIKSLENVNLDSNLIEYVEPGAFHGTNLSLLILKKNRISFLPALFVSDLKPGGLFIFHENPWQCACLLELLVDVKKVGLRYGPRAFSGPRRAGLETQSEPACVHEDKQPCHRSVPAGLPQLPPSVLVITIMFLAISIATGAAFIINKCKRI